jgi:ABC-type phosphate/phosphonate transport system permease subunit
LRFIPSASWDGCFPKPWKTPTPARLKHCARPARPLPAFWSLVLFRWDINVRESIVLGLVGAGGVGMALDNAMNLFQWPRVAMILLAILGVVILAEVVVTYIRKKVI